MRRVIVPEVTRLSLSDGDWIEVKNEISYGDRRRIRSATFSGVTQGEDDRERYQFDVGGHALALVHAYLVDWSLRGADDKPLDITTDARKRAILETVLTEEAFEELHLAIERHIATLIAKKNATPTPTQTPTSPTPEPMTPTDLRLMFLFKWSYEDLLSLPAPMYDAAIQLVNDEILPPPQTRPAAE